MAAAGAAERWVCLDVGETLIDETRVWGTWADLLRLPRLTFMAALGAVIAHGEPHQRVFDLVGRSDWHSLRPAFDDAYGGFTPADLYPDALPTIDRLRSAGYRLAIVANQPLRRSGELQALGINADVVAMSDELGVHKPSPLFFGRVLELTGATDPAAVAHVGDRLDNDVLPALAAGMRSIWLRRGPWGFCAPGAPPPEAFVVNSLAEFGDRIDEVWSARGELG